MLALATIDPVSVNSPPRPEARKGAGVADVLFGTTPGWHTHSRR